MIADPRVRVLQVIGSLNIGGAEAVLSQLATGLNPDEFDVSVCCTRAAGPVAERLRSQGVVVRVAASPRRAFRHLTILGLVQHVRQARAHIVHTHGSTALVQAGPLGGFRYLPPWIHTFHYGNYPYPKAPSLQSSIERWMSPFPRQLVAVSEFEKRPGRLWV